MKKKFDYDNDPETDKFAHLDTVISSTECTGLIPTPPLTEDELESYLDLYSVPPQGIEEKNTDSVSSPVHPNVKNSALQSPDRETDKM